METPSKRMGRPPKKDKLRNVAISLRVTEDVRELLRQITEALHEPSDTQTLTRLILAKAEELNLPVPGRV